MGRGEDEGKQELDEQSGVQKSDPPPPGIAKMLAGVGGDSGSDDSHRMVMRVGGGDIPDDADERQYGSEEGDHAALAAQALAAGDLRRAIYHLGRALANDPSRAAWLALLDRWIVATGASALDLVPLTDPQYFGTLETSAHMMRLGNRPDHHMEVIPGVSPHYYAKVGVHAYILAAQNRLKEAIDLLLRLARVKPEIPYLVWITRWQDRPNFAAALDADLVAAAGAGVIQRHPGTYEFFTDGRAEIAAYLPLFRVAYAAFPQHPGISSLYSMLLRKNGAFDEAVRVARMAPDSYNTFTALAMGEAARGDQNACIAAYQRAVALDPQNVAARNDIANAYLLQGKLSEALATYEESTRLDPSDPFELAFTQVAYLRYLQQPSLSSEWLAKLRELAQSQQNARHMLSIIGAPYLGKLPYASEAIINGLRNLLASQDGAAPRPSDPMKISATIIESPSARLALQRTLATRGVALEMTVAKAPTPDTRQPLRPVEYQIWTYHGMDPLPAVAPPDSDVSAHIASLVRRPYTLDGWHSLARALGEWLDPAALPSLLGVMVHPPAAPAGWHEWDWIASVQLASALTIAYVDTGWEGSRRHAALTYLMYGPMDWSGAAAIIATALLARQDMRIHIAFDQLCLDLWNHAPDDGPWALEPALVYGLLFTKSFSREARSQIQAYFARERGCTAS